MLVEQLKAHKWLYGGLLVLFLVIWYVLGRSGGANSAASASPYGDVAAGNDFAAAQLAAQTQIAGIQAQGAAQDRAIQGSIDYANVQAAAQHDANTIAASVAESQINATLQEHSLADTLSAQVAEGAQQNQTQQLAIATSGQVQQTTLITQALVSEAQTQADVAKVNAQTYAQINAQNNATNQAIQTQSWLSKIFG